MASEATTTTTRETTTRSRGTNGGDIAAGQTAVQTAVHEVKGAIAGVGRQMPEVARASRSAVNDVFKVIESGSDERVSTGVALSLGLAIGMLVGGAPRILVALALAPLAAMGLVLADRRARGSKASSSS
jgi:hypothetical protein